MTHLDRDRAEGFGAVASDYDRVRPSYPAAVIDDVLDRSPVDVLDVGCGTGKLAALLLGSGRRVVGIEPDARMAEVARSRGVAVEVGRLEDWEPAGRRFDLVVSGTAWHWVDPVVGATTVAAVLRPGGLFAAMWNEYHHHPASADVMTAAYAAHCPSLRTFALGTEPPVTPADDLAGAALADGPFDGVRPGVRRDYSWPERYTPERWVALLGTLSDHRGLDPDVRSALFAELEERLGALGPTFEVVMTTSVLSAARR